MSANETLTSKRNSSIELLRIVAMIGVILLHYNNKTVGGGMAYVEKDSLNYTILCVIEALTITAVDVYILITGYYLSKKETRNLFRVFELIFQVCFFKEVIYFLEIYSGQAVSLRRLFGNLIPNNYFVVLYCALYISSIAINNGIRSLSVAALKKVVMIIMMLFSVWPILVDLLNEVTQKEYIGLSTIGMYGSQSGYTIVTFVCLFVIGAFIRKLGTNLPSPSKCLLSFLALSTIEFIWYICEKRLFQGYYTATFYHNPIIIGAAVSLLCLFLQLDLKSQIVNRLSRASFLCFLIHTPFLRILHIEDAVHNNALIMILHMIISSLAIYLVSYVVYEIYTRSIGSVVSRLEKYFPVIKL